MFHYFPQVFCVFILVFRASAAINGSGAGLYEELRVNGTTQISNVCRFWFVLNTNHWEVRCDIALGSDNSQIRVFRGDFQERSFYNLSTHSGTNVDSYMEVSRLDFPPVFPHPFPRYIWLTYISGYSQRELGERPPPGMIDVVSPAVSGTTNTCQWQLSDEYPFCPAWLTGRDLGWFLIKRRDGVTGFSRRAKPFQDGFTNLVFEPRNFENVNGWHLPTSFGVETFSPTTQGLKVRTRLHASVIEFSQTNKNVSFFDRPPKDTLVKDSRLLQSGALTTAVHYVSVDQRIRGTNEVRQSHDKKLRLRVPRKEIQMAPYLTGLIFATLVALPLILFRKRKRKN